MKYLSIFVITALLISSCNVVNTRRIKGDGNITSKTYTYKNFSSVEVENAMKVFLRQDSAYSVRIETDENLFNWIEVQVKDGNKLIVENKDNVSLSPTDEIKIYITMPLLDKISLSGASQLHTENKFIQDQKLEVELSGASSGNLLVKAPIVDIEVTGASTIHAEGECRDIIAEAVGASTINAFNLLAEGGKATATGASTIRLFSSVSLKADATGASSIKYRGNPKITANSTGASSVSKDN